MMIKSVILFILFCSSVYAQELRKSSYDEFPEPRNYTSADRGMAKYAALSLLKTKKVILTFDDGPSLTETPRLLDILRKFNVTAAFFILGEKITPETEPLVERMIREGHYVGAHSWNHYRSTAMSQVAFKESLEKTLRAIERAEMNAGQNQNEVYFRFPFGAYGFSNGYHHMNAIRDLAFDLYGENCINFVFWNIDTDDWLTSMTSNEITQNTMAQLEGGMAITHKAVKDPNGNITYIKEPYYVSSPAKGGVVLMHDIHARTVNSVEATILELKLKDYEIIPIKQAKEYDFGNLICTLRN